MELSKTPFFFSLGRGHILLARNRFCFDWDILEGFRLTKLNPSIIIEFSNLAAMRKSCIGIRSTIN